MYQKPGLRGGAPIHSFTRGAKRLPAPSTSASSAGQSQTPQTSNPVVIVTRSEGLIHKVLFKLHVISNIYKTFRKKIFSARYFQIM